MILRFWYLIKSLFFIFYFHFKKDDGGMGVLMLQFMILPMALVQQLMSMASSPSPCQKETISSDSHT